MQRKAEMKHIGLIAKSFGRVLKGDQLEGSSLFWICDFNHDRKIDMQDIALVAQAFSFQRPWIDNG